LNFNHSRDGTVAGSRVETRVKDTRARLIEHANGSTYIFPGALFQLTRDEIAAEQDRQKHRHEFCNWEDGEDEPDAEVRQQRDRHLRDG